jgi:hypothetical protein
MTEQEAMVIGAMCELGLSYAQATKFCQMLNEACVTHQFIVRQPKGSLSKSGHFVFLFRQGERLPGADVALTS